MKKLPALILILASVTLFACELGDDKSAPGGVPAASIVGTWTYTDGSGNVSGLTYSADASFVCTYNGTNSSKGTYTYNGVLLTSEQTHIWSGGTWVVSTYTSSCSCIVTATTLTATSNDTTPPTTYVWTRI